MGGITAMSSNLYFSMSRAYGAEHLDTYGQILNPSCWKQWCVVSFLAGKSTQPVLQQLFFYCECNLKVHSKGQSCHSIVNMGNPTAISHVIPHDE